MFGKRAAMKGGLSGKFGGRDARFDQVFEMPSRGAFSLSRQAQSFPKVRFWTEPPDS